MLSPKSFCVFATLCSTLLVFTTPSKAGTIWDLGADWSDEANPNGPWSYNAGDAPIMTHWDDWSGDQPAWAAEQYPLFGHIPAWAKANEGTAGSGCDYPLGIVFCHSNDPGHGTDVDLANVTWTSPIDGSVSVHSECWFTQTCDPAHDGRSNAWRLYHGDSLLASGIVGDDDAYDSSNPAAFSTLLSVSIGDVIRFEFERLSTYGTLSALRLTIDSALSLRAGNVDTGSGGPPVDLVFVDGGRGDDVERKLSVTADVATTMHIDKAPSLGSKGGYGVWIYEGEAAACVPIELKTGKGVLISLGSANICLPCNNTVTPDSCPCPVTFPVGRTSKPFGAGKAAIFCLNKKPGFPKSPTDFSITYPAGTYMVVSLQQDLNSINSPAKNIAIGNTIVVVSQ